MIIVDVFIALLAIIGLCCLAYAIGGAVELYQWMKEVRRGDADARE